MSEPSIRTRRSNLARLVQVTGRPNPQCFTDACDKTSPQKRFAGWLREPEHQDAARKAKRDSPSGEDAREIRHEHIPRRSAAVQRPQELLRPECRAGTYVRSCTVESDGTGRSPRAKRSRPVAPKGRYVRDALAHKCRRAVCRR